MSLYPSVLLACALLMFSSPRLSASEPQDLKNLQGTWHSISFKAKGSEDNSRKFVLTFRDDQLTVMVDGEKHAFVFELDVEAEPKRLDIITIEGGIEVKRNRGLYELRGDTLTICHGGQTRPDKLEIREGPFSLDSLIVLKRRSQGPRP